MKQYTWHYGEGDMTFSVDETRVVNELHMATVPTLANPEQAIREALDNPIASAPLKALVKPGETVAILANDPTRVANSFVFMPILVDYLNECGIPDSNITVIFALGTHREMTEAEMVEAIGENVAGRVRMVNSYAKKREDFIELGTTSFGTPVRFHKDAVNADHIICTGSVVHHFFAGYGGGRKALLPGCAEYETIRCNHSLMLNPAAEIGRLEGNPIYEDQVEGTEMCRPTFLLNVVLNEQAQFTGVFCGDYIKAHKEACRLVDTQNGVRIKERTPIVIATCGGYPKDINIYQMQKTMDNAVKAVAPGGAVILLAECREGSGSPILDETIRTFDSIDAIEESVRRDFQIGRHKAYAVTRLMKKADFYLISSLDSAYAKKAFFHPVASVEAAMKLLDEKYGNDAKITLMPYASYTVPLVED